MRSRSERTLKELYDRTERILEAEITPVLKGNHRIKGPVDDSDLQFGRTSSGAFPTEEKYMFVNDSIGMKTASGTCNIWSAPCSSCMHNFRSSSVIGSTSDSGCSGNICSRGKAGICFSVDANGKTLYKNKTCDDSQNASSETSNMLGMSSSHNSYSENATSKSTLNASAAHSIEYLDKPQMGFSGELIKNEQPLEEKTYQGHFSADNHILIHLGCRDSSGQGEEQLGLECHGDNISCITGGIDANISDYGDNLYLDNKDTTCGVVLTNNLIPNANETSFWTEDGPQVHEFEEGDFILRGPNTTTDASILDDISNSASVRTKPANSGFPLLKFDVSSVSRSPTSHAKSIRSSFHKADFSDTEGNLNMKSQAGCMNFVKMDNESSLGSFSSLTSAGRKPAALLSVEVSRTNEARSCLSSEKSKVDDLRQEFKTDKNSQISSDIGSKSDDHNKALEKGNALLDSDLLPLENIEIENTQSESALYDVNVCDICGDAGREALLAICSRCSDGAEHTYCMREKLDKLPGIDWLCEECKIKEMENHNVNKSETISGGSKPTFLSQNSQNPISTLIPKKLRKLDKGLESPKISTSRQADHVEVIKVSEASAAPIETASQRRTPVLSCVFSLKSQKIEVRKANMESTKGQSVNGLQASHHSQNSFSSGSFKGRPHSPYCHLSRSVSFSNSIINQKVKLVENDCYKQKIRRETISSKPRNETLVKSINKSASFKSSSSGFSHTEPASKGQPFHQSRIENRRGLDEMKKRIIVEKNLSAAYRTYISKLAAPASMCHLKRNIKSSQKEGNVKRAIESSCQSIVKRSHDESDLSCDVGKKRILHSSKSMENFYEKFSSENRKQWKEVISTGFSAVDGSCIKVDMASHHDVLQLSESDPKDNKIRASNIFISPRSSSSDGNRTLHFQKYNKTGHATQQCSTDEGSAYWPSAERSFIETMKKRKECEDIVDALTSNTRMLNKSKNFDKLDKLSEASAEVICKEDSRDTPSSFSQKNISLVVDSDNNNDSLQNFNVELGKAVAATDSMNLTVHPTELVSKANSLSHIPTVSLNSKSLSETPPREASILASQLRASAIPKLEFIWQGSFNVLSSDSCRQLFDGIQAHLSTCASHSVIELANVVPIKMQLEEVSQTSLWPLQCQGVGPNEENIALFFFAKDNESYEKSYSSLLNKMLKNDLSLRGKVDEAELFIFTSNMLPAYSQRWNMLYYLWGMFIYKKKRCLPTQKKNCESTLDIEFLVQGISELPLRNGPNAQKLDTSVTSKIFSECDTSTEIKQGKSTMCVDLHCLSSDVDCKDSRTKTAAYAVNSLSQVVTDAKIIQEIPLFHKDNSSRTTAKPLDVIDNSEVQIQSSQLSYRVKIGMGCQDNFLSDGANKKTGESPSHACDTNIEASPGRASPVHSVSPNKNIAVEECSKNESKNRKRHCSPTDSDILDYNPRKNTFEIDWADRKYVRSCERARWKQPNGEREQKMTYHRKGSTFGEETLLSSTTISVQQPEISRNVERSFFPVDIGSSNNNKYVNPAHIPSSNDDDDDDDDDDDSESYTLDLELTLGSKSKTTKTAPLLPLLHQLRRSGSSGNDADGDDLSALLSL